ncbi:hypothetical protein SUNI508_06361 [Seiridium unicorne]|uniref:Uncharacterized protein n=1 Tax=Seiridium unicorne TaxID=138068 RepID=A0ABR2V1R4_9PEZI
MDDRTRGKGAVVVPSAAKMRATAKRRWEKYLAARTENNWRAYTKANREQRKEIEEIQIRTRYYRPEAKARDNNTQWAFWKWARLLNYTPPRGHEIPGSGAR